MSDGALAARPSGVRAAAPWGIAAALVAAVGLAAGWGLPGLDFDFLWRRSGFQIAESPVAAGADSPVWLTLAAGLVNTIRVAVAGIAVALPLGIALALLRAARLRPARAVAAAVVEPLRNTPVLLQLFLWYGVFTRALPGPREALEPLPGVLLCNRGLFLPWFGAGGIETPRLAGFNIEGGLALSPELTVLWLGLALFHACYLSEIFRAGFAAVPRGQFDAADALALPRRITLRRVVLPQALGFALPSVAVQALALVKNSSLAIAIGYPDFVAVLGTTVNQNGRAFEGLLLTVAVFLGFNALLGAAIEHGSRRFGLARRADLVVERRPAFAEAWSRREVLALAVLAALLALPAWQALRWGLLDATWSGPAAGCGAGACWAVVAEKSRLLGFGLYPADELWRPVAAAVALLGPPLLFRRRAALALVVGALGWLWLMGGGLGLAPVPSSVWGGFTLTLGLAVLAVVLAAVLAVPLALARRARSRWLSAPATAAVEAFRSVPLVSLLLFADLMIPLLLPQAWQVDKLWRALTAITLLATVGLAEVLRGALAAVPAGQAEAARALGLSPRLTFLLVVLPQAVRIGLPAAVNVFVGTVKDTSLVLIVGILDVTGAAKAAVADPEWRAFAPEIYLFLAAVYFSLCFPIARYARRIEARARGG